MMSQALGGGEFTLRLIPHQKVAPLYWRSDTHTHTHTHRMNVTTNLDPTFKKVEAAFVNLDV
jgi:hypothetical protein